MKVLVTGGVRSGKSRHAEGMLADREQVLYVAAGPTAEEEPDPDWVARIEAHRRARPAGWTTQETRDVAGALGDATSPVLVDCLGTWLTATLDEGGLWDAPATEVADAIAGRADELRVAVHACQHDVVLVTNEVGLGVVPAHRSGRLFRDLLGTVNQRVAQACTEVHLVVAGRVLRL